MKRGIVVFIVVLVFLVSAGFIAFMVLGEGKESEGEKEVIEEEVGEGSSLVGEGGSDREGVDAGYEDALGSLEDSGESKGEKGEVGVIEEGAEDDSGKEKEEYEVHESKGSSTTVSKSGNTNIVTSTPESSSEVTYGEVVDIPGGGSGGGSSSGGVAEKGSGGIDSSNEVDTSKTKTNSAVEKVKDIYKKDLELEVVPDGDGGYTVFKGDFLQVYSKGEGVFFFSNQPEYDKTTIKVLKELGVGLSDSEIVTAIDKVRENGDKVDVGKVSFYFGNNLAVRW